MNDASVQHTLTRFNHQAHRALVAKAVPIASRMMGSGHSDVGVPQHTLGYPLGRAEELIVNRAGQR